MTSLLSPFNFGQKYAYFHAKITIHELASVPLVSGRFQAKWRIKNVYGLQSLPVAAQAHHLMHSAAHSNHHTGEQAGKPEDGPKRRQSLRRSQNGSVNNQPDEDGDNDENSNENDGTADLQADDEGKGSVNETAPLKKSFPVKSSGEADGEDEGARQGANGEDQEQVEGTKGTHHRGARFFSGVKGAFRSRKASTTSKRSEDSIPSQLRKSTDTRADEQSDSLQTPDDSFGRAKAKRIRTPSTNGHALSPSSAGATLEDEDEPISSTTVARGPSSAKGKEKEPTSEGSTDQTSLHFHAEPKGSTTSERVKEHVVHWERELEVGLRIAVDKPRGAGSSGTGASMSAAAPSSNTNASSSASVYSASSSGEGARHQTSNRDLRERHDADREKEQQLADAWGVLAQAELKINVNSNIHTDASGPNHESHSRLGQVTINLAEFAPHPHNHHHHHHHHQHHHHHHHPHHQQGKGSQIHSHPPSKRSETRRYLLNDSKTNATLKLTIEMTHVAGAREYFVPSIRQGLLVGNMAAHALEAGPMNNSSSKGSSSASSDNGSTVHDDGGDRQSVGSRTRNNGSAASLGNPMANWPPDSVARHSRIPAQNLKTELSHKDAARAVQEGGGGGRLAFSFSGGAHHDRAPEDVVAGIFDGSSSSWDTNASLMLTPTVSRAEKVKHGASAGRKQAAGDKKSTRPGMSSRPSTATSLHSNSSNSNSNSTSNKNSSNRTADKADIRSHEALGGEKPEHYDSVRPALSAEHGSQAAGQIPTRFSAKVTSPSAGPGVDIDSAWRPTEASKSETSSMMRGDSASSSKKQSSPSPSQAQPPRNHSRSSSASTMKSILRSGITPAQSSESSPVSRGNLQEPAGATSGGAGSGSAKSSTGSSSGDRPGIHRRTSLHSRPTSVHWDPSIQHPSAVSTASDPASGQPPSPASQQQPAPAWLQANTSREPLVVPPVPRMITASPSSLGGTSSSRSPSAKASSSNVQSSLSTSSTLPSVPSDSELSLPALVDDNESEGKRRDSSYDEVGLGLSEAMPPKTPPDVARKLALLMPRASALSNQDQHACVTATGEKVTEASSHSSGRPDEGGRHRVIKGTVGLSKDEAKREGYRGVGWGTHSALGIDASFWNASGFAYTPAGDDAALTGATTAPATAASD
ncbi:hypothetical protein FA10DRAFT_265479 [Acaromyces ingoldii]|uniref:C2 NT-type domain-containing protein n=1 Tax=Acaromyces ingoldii TaxID=215250 RepID=A0A316YR98_9BASI|nr:hypothetical protein FA10DRAFT_265479 [Acaromyces ingoldii]PWN91632.1 hypothetical protein FA10DRAFT_265479 [Acaromyces ingoldii]